MGSCTEEGESPVAEILRQAVGIPSSTGHEKPRMNQGGPPSKAKYYLLTDSGTVP